MEESKSGCFDSDILAISEATRTIQETIRRVANYDASVLLTGESGVGKSMYAKVIHKNSKRAGGPFVEINCSAIPKTLLESELFGYVKGSFTGASKEGKNGLIEMAERGTLFLDEVSEIPLDIQVKLLKVIQDKIFTKVGGTKEQKVDFRLITASNKNLRKMIDAGEFREDLFYRLNVIPLKIPPLRSRREEIIPLALFFVDRTNKKYGIHKTLATDIYDWLLDYSYPGNVRELENIIERVLLITNSELVNMDEINRYFYAGDSKEGDKRTLKERLEQYEREIIARTYGECKTLQAFSKALGISQSTAIRKIHKYIKEENCQE